MRAPDLPPQSVREPAPRPLNTVGPFVHDADMDARWEPVAYQLAVVLSELKWHQFIIVNYDAQPSGSNPFAQAAPGSHGVYCEAVSEYFLPSDVWPIDTEALKSEGWRPPDRVAENWWYDDAGRPHDAVSMMLRSLILGRGCEDPALFTWSTGTFPPTSGDGEPIPVDSQRTGIAWRRAA